MNKCRFYKFFFLVCGTNINNQRTALIMIIHIALFRWKEGTEKESIEKALKQVKQLKNKCDGIIDIFCGENFHKESKGLTHGVVIIAKNQDSLDGYRKHSEHKVIAKNIEIIEDDGLGFDFEDL